MKAFDFERSLDFGIAGRKPSPSVRVLTTVYFRTPWLTDAWFPCLDHTPPSEESLCVSWDFSLCDGIRILCWGRQDQMYISKSSSKPGRVVPHPEILALGRLRGCELKASLGYRVRPHLFKKKKKKKKRAS
jgi:hypothetical protein